jgi:hypothetical protein
MMSRVQELIDEHKHEMPTGVAKELLDACAEDAKTNRLYRVVLTKVAVFSFLNGEGEPEVKMDDEVMTLIVEPANKQELQMPRGGVNAALWLTREGKMSKEWLKLRLPATVHSGFDYVLVLHSITPYVPKRERAEVQA